ncbi:MAG: RNA polymerase-binding ATPase, partial [Gammaproteobacteria bacterium RIFCSPLOWO2_02_FULL_52_10]
MQDFIIGQRWLCDADPALGLGTVKVVDQRTVTVLFNATGETRVYARQSAPLTRVVFAVGDVVPSRVGWSLSIEEVREDQGVFVYTGTDEQGRKVALAETGLADVIALHRPADRLFSGRIDPDKWFRLRYQTLNEYHRHLSSDLYGLVGARTSLIPHQLYIAREVARRYSPRVLLADEVGLGKTIEAGLILHQQLLTESARRVLIVVPENLVHQWLVEMLRRFNLYFSIFDEERCQAISANEYGDNPFQAEQLVLCSLTFLAGQQHRLGQVVAGDWDLLVVDEAHHLHWTPQDASPEYRIIEQLALHTRGVLLLTATPEQLGTAGHFARLRLLDPDRFSDYETFVREADTYGSVAGVIGALLDAAPLTDKAIAELSEFIHDSAGQQLLSRIIDPHTDTEQIKLYRQQLIGILVDRHGTGRVLFRNTRAAVKGFPERAVSVYPLPLPESYATVLATYKNLNPDQQQLLLSPEVLFMNGKDSDAPHWTRLDPRLEWLNGLLQQLKPAKVLVITAMQQTALDIAEALKVRSGIYAAVFHERMSLLERDRAAAYFADREQGCRVLICSEIGSEGRNFQFAHHLVLFDLPLNPDLLEQRIGRLDRIGQTETIHIHVPYLENSAQSVMYHWYQEGLNAFMHTCPAGYPVFYQLQAALLEALREATIEHHELPDFIQRTRDLRHEINGVLQGGRDRLLEYNSCRPEIAAGLKQAAEQQDAASNIGQFMDNVFDCFGVHVEEHSRSS